MNYKCPLYQQNFKTAVGLGYIINLIEIIHTQLELVVSLFLLQLTYPLLMPLHMAWQGLLLLQVHHIISGKQSFWHSNI